MRDLYSSSDTDCIEVQVDYTIVYNYNVPEEIIINSVTESNGTKLIVSDYDESQIIDIIYKLANCDKPNFHG
jgi:hypothetical protein